MRTPIHILVSLVVVVGCNRNPSAIETRAADEAAIRAADSAFARTGETKDLVKQLTFYVDDGDGPMFLPQGVPLAAGKTAIHEALRPAYDDRNFSVTWRPLQVEAARSGELGYVRGVYETSVKGPDGSTSTDKGKYIEIWKKQPDGSWKLLMDIANSDSPATAAPQYLGGSAVKK
jgi:ketosteroid isomerase-like protein